MVSERGRAGGDRLTGDARRILAVQALRAFAYGLGSVLIGVTLARRGLSGFEVGLVLAALLAGVAFASLAIARTGDRIGRRRWYTWLFVVMGVAGAAFALTDETWLLVLAALTGTVSTEVVESGPFTSLEQAMLPSVAGERDATSLFGTYNTVATLAGSLGALAAGLTLVVDVEPQRLLLVYVAVAVAGAVVTLGLSDSVEPSPSAARSPLGRSRGVVRRLSGLFALDSFGGGFVTQAFIAYWFTVTYGTSPELLGAAFFAMGILQALSFQVAVRLAGRVGLVNTMVFTHLPSNLFLASIPLAPTETAAFALLFARFALSQMDVPTRQAYVVGVVDPEERTAAAAYTNTARYVTRPLGPLVAAPIMQVSLGAPYVIAGVLKSAYDLALYRAFRRQPPRWTA
ncbi:MAG TPA: MFS transporter [Gaiellaceae bacterium]|nr:MFS transporter [Gaiellaceae bacterium]